MLILLHTCSSKFDGLSISLQMISYMSVIFCTLTAVHRESYAYDKPSSYFSFLLHYAVVGINMYVAQFNIVSGNLHISLFYTDGMESVHPVSEFIMMSRRCFLSAFRISATWAVQASFLKDQLLLAVRAFLCR